jgi:hypothetical protein
MAKAKGKGRIEGQFVALRAEVLDSPAWRETSHGGRSLYVSLKRRVPTNRNQAYLSNRTAASELKASRQKIREWFAELEHYGFIALAVPSCLGVDGKGKAPHWRLTELGCTSRTSSEGLFEPGTKDYLKWDGALFDPKPFRRDARWEKTESRSTRGDHPGPHVVTTPGPDAHPLLSQSGRDAGAIEQQKGGRDAGAISSLTTRVARVGLLAGMGEAPGLGRRPWTKPTIVDEALAPGLSAFLDRRARA